MASGMELAINNAEEAAVNAPFNSTGLQMPGQLFFLSCRCSMRLLLHQALWLCVWLHCQVFPPTSIQIAGPLSGFHQRPVLMEFPTSPNPLHHQRGAVATENEIMSTPSQNI